MICYGPCGLIMHLKCCNEMDKNSLTAMKENCYLKYLCHDCRKMQCCYNNVIQMCNEILTRMSENKEEMVQMLEKVNEKVEAQEESINEKIKNECEKAIEMCRKNSEVTKKAVQQIAKATEIASVENKKERALRSSGKGQQMETSEKENKKKTFAEIVAEQKQKQPVSKVQSRKPQDPVILIQPKNKSQSAVTTKKMLKEKLDRKECHIGAVKEGNNGVVIVGINNSEEVENIVSAMKEKVGEEYDVKTPKPIKPRLKILGVDEKLSECDLLSSLKDQNESLNIQMFKVVASYVTERAGEKVYNYIVEVDPEAHAYMMEMERVNIGWGRCRVIECYAIIRCFKCCQFGHKSMECQNEETCSKCAEKHATKECDSAIMCCANCESVKKERKLCLDSAHYAYSWECPVYQRLIERKRRQMGGMSAE